MAAKDRSSFGLSALPVTLFAHLLFIAVTALLLFWLLHIREGLSFKSEIKNKIFNVHPLLMVIGLILIPGEAIIAYTTIPGTRKTQKLVHLVLLFVGIAAGIVGIYAVFKFLHERNVPNLFTLHSWIGIATICLFALQWLLGFLYFYFPGASMFARARAAPWHVFFGIVLFFMAILSAETGLAERFTFLRLEHGQEALVIKFIGVLILFFGVSIGLSVLLPRGWQRSNAVNNSNV